MKCLSKALLSVLILLTNGCVHMPFEDIVFETIDSTVDSRGLVESFRKEIPTVFDVVESTVFTYRGKEMAALSYTKIDENKDMLAIASFTPSGVNLAQVKFEDQKFDYHFNFPKMDRKFNEAKLAEIIVSDVQNIYFDRAPPNNAVVSRKEESISFTYLNQENKTEWIFAGPKTKLYQKKYFHKGRILWNVRYFSYQTQDILNYPSEIYYENYEMNYTLTLRLKEVLG